ncbi:hypothetical protein Ga0100231_024075 [Opitutaceae bacterium TAV4]|nr:hypothetical protein Ga0100231_024075 [Opitutaceae bacterium TAV4]RRK00790.1 hypothetical protein Ga0100230_023650 [Opitutaceae bacterium TAV3]
MSAIDITLDAGILDDLRGHAEAIGITDDEFKRAAKKAITVTTRQLYRMGLSNLAKATGAKSAALRKHHRVSANESHGRVWFGLDPVSLSNFPDSAIRKVPKGFRIKKIGSMVWQRPPKRGDITANVPVEHTTRVYSFGGNSGGQVSTAALEKSPGLRRRARNTSPDALLKIYRRIFNQGFDIADKLGDDADALLEKNFNRELDQIIRRKRYAKK